MNTSIATWYILEYIMPTSVHIPRSLLEAVDRKARAIGVSRNRLIVRAIERELSPSAGWTPGFFEALSDVSPETASAVDLLHTNIRKARHSKRPLKF
ncbi:MAG: ribbon-helix-helix domain-containing protein [Gemmatimonadota bacterium]